MKNVGKKIIILTSICGALISCGNDAENQSNEKTIIDVYKGLELTLGDGLRADEMFQLERCVEITGKVPKPVDGQEQTMTDNSPTVFSELKVSAIDTFKQMDSFSDISVSGNVRSGAYSGEFAYDKTEIHNLSSDTAAVGIKVGVDYGRWYFDDTVKLKKEYEDVYKRDPEEFFRRCGTEYVAGYRQGQGVSVLLYTAHSTNYKYEKISFDAKASANTGATSGNVSASFLNVASSLLKLGTLNILVKTKGGVGTDDIKELVTSEAEVKELSKKIATIIGNMSPSNSTRVKYLTRKYPNVNYSSLNNNPIFLEHRKMVLTSLFSDYRRLSLDLNRASDLALILPNRISKWGSLCDYATAETGRCEDFINEINVLKRGIEAAIGKIENLAMACHKAKEISECKTSNPIDVNVNNLIIKRWDNQYKAELRRAFLLASLNPPN